MYSAYNVRGTVHARRGNPAGDASALACSAREPPKLVRAALESYFPEPLPSRPALLRLAPGRPSPAHRNPKSIRVARVPLVVGVPYTRALPPSATSVPDRVTNGKSVALPAVLPGARALFSSGAVLCRLGVSRARLGRDHDLGSILLPTRVGPRVSTVPIGIFAVGGNQ